MELTKLIGYAVAILFLLVLLKAVLPYLIIFLAVYCGYYLYRQCHPKN
jgi:uncharacterized membrane protein